METIDRLKVRVNKAGNKSKRQPAQPEPSMKRHLEPSTLSPCSGTHQQTDLQVCKRQRVDSCSPCNDESPPLPLPPPLHPLTESNLRKHTQQSNSGQQLTFAMADTETVVSQSEDDLSKLERHGVVMDNDQPYPDIIEEFVTNIVEKSRSDETPGARQLHRIQELAASTKSESEAAEKTAIWLMFRDESNEFLHGEEFISFCHEATFHRQYVQRDDPTWSLSQPRPDRANGYVSHQHTHGVLTSRFSKEDETIIREVMGPILQDKAFFAWLTAHFRSARGRSPKYAARQCARDGVAAGNYMRAFLALAGIIATELDTVHFSFTCNAADAELFIHWIGADGRHHMKRVCKAGLRADNRHHNRNESMVYMRKCLRNILNWAKGDRLERIKDAVQIVRSQREAEAAAQARSTSSRSRTVAASTTSSGLRSSTQQSQASPSTSRSSQTLD